MSSQPQHGPQEPYPAEDLVDFPGGGISTNELHQALVDAVNKLQPCDLSYVPRTLCDEREMNDG